MGYKEKVCQISTLWKTKNNMGRGWQNRSVVEKLTRGNLPFDTWNKNFKMSKECFYLLAAHLVQVIGSKPNSRN